MMLVCVSICFITYNTLCFHLQVHNQPCFHILKHVQEFPDVKKETLFPIQFRMNTWELQTPEPETFKRIDLNLFYTSTEQILDPPVRTKLSGRPQMKRFKRRAKNINGAKRTKKNNEKEAGQK